MLVWLLLGTVVYAVTLFVPSLFLVSTIGYGRYLGTRDDDPAPAPRHGRALRASRNFIENYPIFMGLGILALVVPEADMAQASLGAMLFVLARIAYLPLYILAVPFLRSGAFVLGWIGTVLMGLALL